MKEIKQTGLMLDQEIAEEARKYAKDLYNTSLSGVVRALLVDFVETERRIAAADPHNDQGKTYDLCQHLRKGSNDAE